jgi:hypothetical protein
VEAGSADYLKGRDRPAGGSGRVSTVRVRTKDLLEGARRPQQKEGIQGPGGSQELGKKS